METVYNKIVELFNDNPQVFTDSGVPILRHIDIHMGQVDDPEQWEVFTPAMFIAWSIAPGIPGESDMLTLEFHIVQDPGVATESFSPTITEGLEYMRLINACKYILNYLRADNTTPLKWAGERPAYTPFFRYHILTYTCGIDAYTLSLHRPVYGSAIGEDVNITSAKLKPTKPPETTFIDTY